MNDLFHEGVYQLLATVPPGRVVTYGQLARALGAPRSARQVGRALSRLPADRQIPWHRVLNREGRISRRWPELRMEHQAELLRAEGVEIDPDGVVSLSRYVWELPDWSDQAPARPPEPDVGQSCL